MPKVPINVLIKTETLSRIQELYKKRHPAQERSFSNFIDDALIFYITEWEAKE